MTLVELQKVLGKQIEDLTDPREPFENKRRLAEQAIVVSSLAKQMINNADVVLRSVKFMQDNKLDENSPVRELVMGQYALAHKNEDGVVHIESI